MTSAAEEMDTNLLKQIEVSDFVTTPHFNQ